MFRRRRLTKLASPPPAIPSVGNTVEPSHPATKDDPSADAYKTGDPGDWGDTPTKGPYENGPPPAVPGAESAGDEHPAAKKASDDEAMEALRKKATKSIKLIEGMADKSASQGEMENAAMVLMNLPESQLDSTLSTLTKLGFFTAMDDMDDMDEGMGDDMGAYAMSNPMAAKIKSMEDELASLKSQMGMGVVVDESPGDDIEDVNTFTGLEAGSDDPAVDAMYHAMVQEEAAKLAAGKKSDDEDDDDDDDDEEETEVEVDEESVKMAGQLYLQTQALRQAMEEEDDDSEEGKEAKKAAAQALSEAEDALAKLAGKLPPEFLKNQKGKKDDDEEDEEDDKGDKEASSDDKKSEEEEVEVDEETEAAKKAAAEAEAAAMIAAAAEQGTSPEDAIILANAGNDPMGLDNTELGSDAMLSLLYKSGSEDEDEEADEDDDKEGSKKAAQAKTASGPRPQPKNPGVGPDTLGNLVHTASSGGSDVEKLSSLWASAPNISDHFS